MSGTLAFATVRFEVIGFHEWGQPGPGREYLGQKHRHKFFVTASVQVFHDDREIEFHDFQDFCRKAFTVGVEGGDFGGLSCEVLARNLLA